MKREKCILLAGGDLSESFLCRYMEKYPEWKGSRVICVDRGLHFGGMASLWPDLLVGDFDSAPEQELKAWREWQKAGKTEIISLNPVKDMTDTHVAMEEALQGGAREILVFGAMGGRQDHFLGNINLLMLPLKKGAKAWLVDEQNKICLAEHEYEIEKKDRYGTYISFLPLTQQVRNVTMKGFRYEVEHITMSLGDTLGISNEVWGEKGVATWDSGIFTVVESKDAEN